MAVSDVTKVRALTWDKVVKHLDGWEARYLNRKVIGGQAFKGGFFYEFHYSLARLVLYTNDVSDRNPANRFHVATGCISFVDDVLTFDPVGVTYAQLRSGPTTWSAGDHPLTEAFYLQKRLLADLEIKADLRLVVSGRQMQRRLMDSRKWHLDVTVDFFPVIETLDALLTQGGISTAIDRLTSPVIDRVSRMNALRHLAGSWMALGMSGSLQEVLDATSSAEPMFGIRVSGGTDLPLRVTEFLEKHFTLSFSGGTVFVEGKDIDFRGDLSINSGSAAWTKFESWICVNADASAEQALEALDDIDHADRIS